MAHLLRADTGTPGRFNGDTFFARDANVSLSGGFGTVKLGRSMAPNFLPTILFNPFGDSFTLSPLVLHGNIPWTHFRQRPPHYGSDTAGATKSPTARPKFGGLSANLHYQFGEQANANQRKTTLRADLIYNNGPLALTAFTERAQVTNPAPATDGIPQANWMLGGSYDFSAGQAVRHLRPVQSCKTQMPPKAKPCSLGM